jgi:predicted Zn-dependent peptidase
MLPSLLAALTLRPAPSLAKPAASPDARPAPAELRALPTARGLDPSLFPIVEKTLPNGLQVRLLRDPGVPTVTYYTFFKVGSRNERPGITGISHLFEHMMFNGSAKFGPKEFDRQLEARGGSSNAFTSSDMTAYYEDFDRDALPLVIDLESDRMRALRINDESLASEREVVKEERRFRVDNDIGGMLDEQLDALAFLAHPYHWPVIGWMGDLERISRADCEQYFRTYYAPNNAVLFVVGDFDLDGTMRLIEQAYGDIPAGPPIPVVAAFEPEQMGERRAQVRYPAQSPTLTMAYRAVPASDRQTAALDVVQAVLGIGEGARLSRSLVREQEVATAVGAWFEWRLDPGLFKIVMELAPGKKPAPAIAALDKELAKLQDRPLAETELLRAKNILRGQFLRGLGTHNGKAHALGEHEVLLGSWRKVFETLERYEAVTAADVQAAARNFLRPEKRTLVELVPIAPEAEAGQGE